MNTVPFFRLWSDFLAKQNHLENCIQNVMKEENVEEDTKALFYGALKYFELYQKMNEKILEEGEDPREKIMRGYVQAKMGAMAIEWNKVKENKKEIYKKVIDLLKKENKMQMENLLEEAYEKILENYTPFEIHILQGKKEEEYEGWY